MAMDFTALIGLVGTALAGIAYLPQIVHLVKEHCSAGISRPAYWVWLLASIAILIHASAIHSAVFILFSGMQLVANVLIIALSYKYQGVCASHVHLDHKP